MARAETEIVKMESISSKYKLFFQVPGIAPSVISGLSDQEKGTLWEAVQPPTASTRTKVRALLQMADVLIKAVVSKESLTPTNASLVCSKIIEVTLQLY